jgi:hypothetical protein
VTDLTEYAVAKAIGARRERERIIALLEAEMPPCDGHNAHYCGRECDVLSFIALIKGENE